MFIVNNIDYVQPPLEVEEIVNILLEKKYWLFSKQTPKIKEIKVGDRVVVYIAGKGKRYFTASFTVSSKLKENKFNVNNEREQTLFSLFDYAIRIDSISLWRDRVYMKTIKDSLSFITDKKNYGLFLRQSVRVIPEKDFKLIFEATGITWGDINDAT